MQLKSKKPSISMVLASATGSLLTAASGIAAEQDVGWEFDTAALYYSEQDNRVKDSSLSLNGTRRFEDGRVLALGVTLDSLTGASPTGAVPLNQPQTFTRPSSRGQYVTPANKLPVDNSFKDSRTAGFVNWTQPISEGWLAAIGASFSSEYDYQHLGFNASVSRELDRRNRIVSAGVAFAQDTLDPEGGIPIPLAEMQDIGDVSSKKGVEKEKSVTDILVGVTQVLDKNMIAQINYSFSYSDGYLNDPFKFLTVLDSNGDLVQGPGPLLSYHYEARPEERTKHSLFVKLKSFLAGNSLDTSYRYMRDDWGISSHTIDARYRFNFSKRYYLEPHLRFYSQSEADFYAPNLQATLPLPDEASSDYRLADFQGTTLGLKLGFHLANGKDLSARLEWYRQQGDAKIEGVAVRREVFPDLDAVIFQLQYRFHL